MIPDRIQPGVLQARLDRRLDVKAPRLHAPFAIELHELIFRPAEEVRVEDVLVERARMETQRRVQRPLQVDTRDRTGCVHRPQHVVSAEESRLRVAERIVDRRRLRQAGEECGLRQRQRARVTREVGLRAGLGAECMVAVEDLVHVRRENLLLTLLERE